MKQTHQTPDSEFSPTNMTEPDTGVTYPEQSWRRPAWLQAIRPRENGRHRLASEYTYWGYVALYLFAANHAAGRRVLDAGCGAGFGARILAQTALHLFAFDLERNDLVRAKARYQKENLSFFAADALNIPLPDDSIDLVVSFETFEHITPSQASRFLTELRRVLAPSGQLIISTPNRVIYHKISLTAGHINEVSVDEFFARLGTIFPSCRPFYQRKGELDDQKLYYRLITGDSWRWRRWLPGRLKRWLLQGIKNPRALPAEQMLDKLSVRPAGQIAELQDAVIQLAVCEKTRGKSAVTVD